MKVYNSDAAYHFIREKILTGAYAPGTPLSTRDIAKEVGVSRTPVREALRQLETDGFVVIRRYFRAVVKSMDIEEFTQLCGLRQGLETYAAGQAAQRRTEAELAAIRRPLDAMHSILNHIVKYRHNRGRVAKLLQDDVREDIQFHLAIVSASRNTLVKIEIQRLQLVARITAPPFYHFSSVLSDAQIEFRKEVNQHHQDIYDAIAEQNSARAKETMERHIQGIIDCFDQLLSIKERTGLHPNLGLKLRLA